MNYSQLKVTCESCDMDNIVYLDGVVYVDLDYEGKCGKCSEAIRVSGTAAWLSNSIPEDAIKLTPRR